MNEPCDVFVEKYTVYACIVDDLLTCVDATNGAHFLSVGHTYRVRSIQVDSKGRPRFVLLGMEAAWEAWHFRPATLAEQRFYRFGPRAESTGERRSP